MIANQLKWVTQSNATLSVEVVAKLMKIEVRLTRVPIRCVKFAGSGNFAHRKQGNPYYILSLKANSY
jgi:hypothetical protein